MIPWLVLVNAAALLLWVAADSRVVVVWSEPVRAARLRRALLRSPRAGRAVASIRSGFDRLRIRAMVRVLAAGPFASRARERVRRVVAALRPGSVKVPMAWRRALTGPTAWAAALREATTRIGPIGRTRTAPASTPLTAAPGPSHSERRLLEGLARWRDGAGPESPR